MSPFDIAVLMLIDETLDNDERTDISYPYVLGCVTAMIIQTILINW